MPVFVLELSTILVCFLSRSLPFIPVRSLRCSSYLFVFVDFLYFYLFILYVQSAVAATAAPAIESKSRMLYCYDCCYRCYCFDHFYCSNNSQTKLPRKNKREQKKLPNWLFYGVKLPIQAIWYSNWVNVVCKSLYIHAFGWCSWALPQKSSVHRFHLWMLRFAHAVRTHLMLGNCLFVQFSLVFIESLKIIKER